MSELHASQLNTPILAIALTLTAYLGGIRLSTARPVELVPGCSDRRRADGGKPPVSCVALGEVCCKAWLRAFFDELDSHLSYVIYMNRGLSSCSFVVLSPQEANTPTHLAKERKTMSIDFIVHDADDSVGVAVVEGIQAGQELTGWVMEGDRTITCQVSDPIPIGHKLAIRDLVEGDTVIKYSVDIGHVTQPIKEGEHLHVHNVKTKRW
jgi:(2R)-sulfolactate sulfo-lyase subunit alpha